MKLEAPAPRSGSASNTCQPDIWTFHQSGSSEQPGLEMLAGRTPTLGASSFSHARARLMAALVGALASSASFASDSAIAQALVPERLAVPIIEVLEAGSDGRVDATTPEMRRLLRHVITAIEQEPVEDGVLHPAEPRLAEFLRQYGAATLYAEMFEGRRSATLVASLLRLLGRRKLENARLREEILRAALASSSIEVRDAAVQAAELWEDPTAIELLRNHTEQNPWLADYIGRVLQEIAG